MCVLKQTFDQSADCCQSYVAAAYPSACGQPRIQFCVFTRRGNDASFTGPVLKLPKNLQSRKSALKQNSINHVRVVLAVWWSMTAIPTRTSAWRETVCVCPHQCVCFCGKCRHCWWHSMIDDDGALDAKCALGSTHKPVEPMLLRLFYPRCTCVCMCVCACPFVLIRVRANTYFVRVTFSCMRVSSWAMISENTPACSTNPSTLARRPGYQRYTMTK